MSKRIIIGLVLLGFLIMPGIAGAAFFDSSDWWMEPSQWVEIVAEEGVAVGKTELYDYDDALNWTSDGWTGGDAGDRDFASKWTFILDDDFEFSVDFHYDHDEGLPDDNEGGIGVSLYYGEMAEPDVLFSLGAGNWYGGQNQVYYSELELPGLVGGFAESWWLRDSLKGTFQVGYDVTDDDLELYTIDEDGDYVGGAEYNGLTAMGIDQLGVYFGGWSDGATLVEGEAFLENFEVTNEGTMTPEPVSSILFLVGGVSLAAFRYRKRKK